ncbi:hypothetical protein ACTPEF_25930, partial [Clostridioides difficile]
MMSSSIFTPSCKSSFFPLNLLIITPLTLLFSSSFNSKYLDVEDSNYIECLNYIANLTLESIRGSGLRKPLEFIPINF